MMLADNGLFLVGEAGQLELCGSSSVLFYSAAHSSEVVLTRKGRA